MTVSHKSLPVKSFLLLSPPHKHEDPGTSRGLAKLRVWRRLNSSAALFLQRVGVGRVFGRLAVEVSDQFLRRRRYSYGPFEDDILRGQGFSIDARVGVIVRANRRAIEGNAGKQAAVS